MFQVSFGDGFMIIIFAQLLYVIRDVYKVKTTLNGLKGRCPLMGGPPDETKT